MSGREYRHAVWSVVTARRSRRAGTGEHVSSSPGTIHVRGRRLARAPINTRWARAGSARPAARRLARASAAASPWPPSTDDGARPHPTRAPHCPCTQHDHTRRAIPHSLVPRDDKVGKSISPQVPQHPLTAPPAARPPSARPARPARPVTRLCLARPWKPTYHSVILVSLWFLVTHN